VASTDQARWRPRATSPGADVRHCGRAGLLFLLGCLFIAESRAGCSVAPAAGGPGGAQAVRCRWRSRAELTAFAQVAPAIGVAAAALSAALRHPLPARLRHLPLNQATASTRCCSTGGVIMAQAGLGEAEAAEPASPSPGQRGVSPWCLFLVDRKGRPSCSSSAPGIVLSLLLVRLRLQPLESQRSTSPSRCGEGHGHRLDFPVAEAGAEAPMTGGAQR